MTDGVGRCLFVTMDVEEWYDYFFLGANGSSQSLSVLDGAEWFLDLAGEMGFKGTFFVLDHIVRSRPALVRRMAIDGHEVASHGADHRLLSEVSEEEFKVSLLSAKSRLEDTIGGIVRGFRAPSLSITQRKLDLLGEIGFSYDSSVIDHTSHPLYGTVELDGWTRRSRWVYERNGFFEFKIPTARALGRNIPVAGGGYMRIIPWRLFRRLVFRSYRNSDSHLLYVHPFECTKNPVLGPDVRLSARMRFQTGRGHALWHVRNLVDAFRETGCRTATFSEYLVHQRADRGGAVSAPL